VNRIHLAQDNHLRQNFVIKVMNLQMHNWREVYRLAEQLLASQGGILKEKEDTEVDT
jgi:hypothetical protein